MKLPNGFSPKHPILFGNHILDSDGILFARLKSKYRSHYPNSSSDIRYALRNAHEIAIVKGTFFELKHNEHQSVEMDIPEGKIVFLSPQIQKAMYEVNGYYD